MQRSFSWKSSFDTALWILDGKFRNYLNNIFNRPVKEKYICRSLLLASQKSAVLQATVHLTFVNMEKDQLWHGGKQDIMHWSFENLHFSADATAPSGLPDQGSQTEEKYKELTEEKYKGKKNIPMWKLSALLIGQ